MNTAIQDTFLHPIDTGTLLSWAMRTWEYEPNLPLLIITNSGDGDGLDNRLRVKLAKTRRLLHTSGMKNVKRFGMKTTVVPWTDSNGRAYDAVCLERFITETQKYAMIFNRMDMQ